MNELSYFTGITRKRLQSPPEHGKINLQLANITKGGTHDRHGIRTSDSGRSSQETQSFQVHRDQACSQWKVRIHHGREPLQSKPRGPGAIYSQADQDRGSTREVRVAVRSPAKPWKSKANDLSSNYEQYAYCNYRQRPQTLSRHKLILCKIHRRAARRKGARLCVFSPLYSNSLSSCLF